MSASSEVSDTQTGETITSQEATGSFSNFSNIMAETESGDQPVQTPAQVDDSSTNPDELTPAPAQPPVPIPPQAPKGRDYSGLDPDEVRLFKAMSNEAYAKLLPIYKASKNPPQPSEDLMKLQEELEQARKSRWYDHEQAYTLSPEYSAAKANLDDLSFEERYWEQQLALAEEGKPVQLLTKKNPDGTYTAGEEQEPSPQIKAQLIAALTRASQYKHTVMEKVNSLQESYSSNWKSLQAGLEKVDKDAFGSLDMQHPGVKSEYSNWINRFPVEARNNLQTQMLAKSMVVIQGLIQQLNQKNVTGAVKSATTNTAKAAGPGSSNRISPSAPSTQDEDARWKQLLGGKSFA